MTERIFRSINTILAANELSLKERTVVDCDVYRGFLLERKDSQRDAKSNPPSGSIKRISI